MTNSALHPIRLVKAILSFEDYRSNPYGVTESDMQEYHAMHTSAFDFGDSYRYPEAAQALAAKEAQQRAWAEAERERNRTYSDPEAAEGELDQVYYDPDYDPNEGTQMDDPEDEYDDPEDYGITAEDMAEFRQRNIERGTASTHWY